MLAFIAERDEMMMYKKLYHGFEGSGTPDNVDYGKSLSADK